MSVNLPPEIESFVDHEVAAGAYASREAVLVAAIELLKQRQQDLRRLHSDIQEGLQGEGVPAEEVFARLRQQFSRGSAGESP